MTLGQTLFILTIMPFTIIGILVVTNKVIKLFETKHKNIDKQD